MDDIGAAVHPVIGARERRQRDGGVERDARRAPGLQLAREGFESASNGEQRNQMRALLEWIVDKSVRDRLASVEEKVMEWEGKAMVKLPTGEAVQYERSSIEMALKNRKAELWHFVVAVDLVTNPIAMEPIIKMDFGDRLL